MTQEVALDWTGETFPRQPSFRVTSRMGPFQNHTESSLSPLSRGKVYKLCFCFSDCLGFKRTDKMSCFANAVSPHMRMTTSCVTNGLLGHPSINPKDRHSCLPPSPGSPVFALPEPMVLVWPTLAPRLGALARSFTSRHSEQLWGMHCFPVHPLHWLLGN